ARRIRRRDGGVEVTRLGRSAADRAGPGVDECAGGKSGGSIGNGGTRSGDRIGKAAVAVGPRGGGRTGDDGRHRVDGHGERGRSCAGPGEVRRGRRDGGGAIGKGRCGDGVVATDGDTAAHGRAVAQNGDGAARLRGAGEGGRVVAGDVIG